MSGPHLRPSLAAGLASGVIVLVAGCALRSGAVTPRPPADPARAVAPAPESRYDGTPPTPVITAAHRGDFTGTAACISCHPRAAALHARSTHAHTLSEVAGETALAGFRSKQVVTDPRLKVRYSVRTENGRPVYHVQRLTNRKWIDVTPRYCLGSGRIGQTFLLEKDGVFMETRTSYYPSERRWSWTPGQDDGTQSDSPVGKTVGFNRTVACFLCHSTNVVLEGRTVHPEQSLFNIGCERCHGPGREHVESVKANRGTGKIYSLKGIGAEAITTLCSECHRAPIQMDNRQLAAYPDLPRFAAPALSISKCYTESSGRLSCITCHNAHSMEVKSFDGPCMSCHSGQRDREKLCPVNTKSGCVSCHMPLKHVNLPVDRKFRTHWIRIYDRPSGGHPPSGTAAAVPGARGSGGPAAKRVLSGRSSRPA